MRRLLKVGCLILCVFFCFSCTKPQEDHPAIVPQKNVVLEKLKEVVTSYQFIFEDQTSLFEEDESEKGLTSAYIAGDNDTRICYFGYEDASFASIAFQEDQKVLNTNSQSRLLGQKEKENYSIMNSTQHYVDNDVQGAIPKVHYTYSILTSNHIVVIVSSDETLAGEILNACGYSY